MSQVGGVSENVFDGDADGIASEGLTRRLRPSLTHATLPAERTFFSAAQPWTIQINFNYIVPVNT